MARCLLQLGAVRWLLTAFLLCTAACAARPLSATSVAPLGDQAEIPIHIYIGVTARGPAIEPDVLGEWVGQAAEDFAAAGVSFDVASVQYVDAASIDARTRRGRRGLATVGDNPGLHIAIAGPLRRATTRGSWLPRQRVIVLSTKATRKTLSHEIGHAFGLGHERASQNLMCSCDRDPRARFSAMQLAEVATVVARRRR